MTKNNHVRVLVESITSYIDKYDGIEIGIKESQAILETREILLESLKIIQGVNIDSLSKKKQHKIIKKLDDSFDNVINVFSKASISSPEIQETKMSLEKKQTSDMANELIEEQEKKMKKSKKNKKEPKTKKVLKSKAKTEKEANPFSLNGLDLPKPTGDISKDLITFLGVVAVQGDEMRKSHKKIQEALTQAVETIGDLRGQVNILEDRLQELEKR